MSSAVAELEAGLQAMQALKPPGVSGSRITTLTTLCVSNVQSESVLIQKLYTHFKKTPGTHKLGVLYVVDSVTRKWLDQAKQHGQTVNSSAPDGTYAAGVNRVTELIPVLMNDILSSAPADQKDKIKKLVDIWEKGQTFPPKLIESFKTKLNQPNESTTPPGSPPPNMLGSGAAGKPPGPPAIPPNIMETLANLAKQSSAAATQAHAPQSIPLPTASTATPPALSGPFGNVNAGLPQHMMNQPPAVAPVSAPQLPFQLPAGLLAGVNTAQQPAQLNLPFGAPPQANNQMLSGFPGLPGAQQPQQNNVQQNLMLINALMAQGLSLEQISGILSQVSANNAGPAAPTQAPASLVPSAIAAAVAAAGGAAGNANNIPPQFGAQTGGGDWRAEAARDQRYGNRSPHGRGRSRSRSPPYWDNHGSPRDRDGHGRRSSPPRGDRGGSGRGRDYRQRSPPRRGGNNGDGTSPHRNPPSAAEKYVEHDASLPNGCIRVLSRTLFVGGVTIGEPELRQVFAQYGEVQTCIVNKEKRHAFVKMYTRRDAEAAKIGMEQPSRMEDSGLRTRWGVGFGPRDCSDYAKGVSVIPIQKLTEADRKWLLTAPWGGSGGRPIATGLVVEEPDIEIGAGVSSKAISRRMQTDRGGINGPRSTRREEEMSGANSSAIGGGHGHNERGRGGRRGGGGRDHRRDDHGDGHNNNNSSNGGGGDNSGFPFGLTMGANGMPVFPPGFAFPGQGGN